MHAYSAILNAKYFENKIQPSKSCLTERDVKIRLRNNASYEGDKFPQTKDFKNSLTSNCIKHSSFEHVCTKSIGYWHGDTMLL